MRKHPQIDFVYYDLGKVLIKIDKDIVADKLELFSGLKRERIDRIFSCGYAVDQQYGFWVAVGEFDRDELIESVKKGDEIGKKMVQIELEFLRSFKKGIFA